MTRFGSELGAGQRTSGGDDSGGSDSGGSDDSGGGGGSGGSDPGSVTRDRGGAGAGGGGEPTAGLGSGDDGSGGGGIDPSDTPAAGTIDSGGGGLQDPDPILGPPSGGGGGSSGGGSSGGSSGGGGGGGSSGGSGGGSSGGGGGGTTSPSPAPEPEPDPTRTVTGSATLGANTTTVSSAVSETQATAPDLGESVPRATDAVFEFGADVREFQAETTPVEDAGRQTREFFGLPSEANLSQQANEALAGGRLTDSVDVPGPAGAGGTGRTPTTARTPREARLGLRRGALDTIGSGVDTAVDAVPGDERGVAAGATALAVAEPTPFGEAALLGGSAAAGIGGSTLTDPDQGSQPVPRSPFTDSEIDAPSEPGSDGEVAQPSDPNPGVDGEISQPTTPEPGVASELDISPSDDDDAAIRAGQGVLIDEDGDTDAPTITRDDLVDDRGTPDQDPPGTRERQRRDDLDVFERDFPGRERQVIGRGGGGEDGLVSDDVPGQGTDVTTGTTDGVGGELDTAGGSPLPPLIGATDPDLDVAPDAADVSGIDDLAAPEVGDGTTDTGTPGGTITGTTQGIGVGERPDTDGDTDTGGDTDTDSGSDTTTRERNRIQTSLVEASATIEAAEATPSDIGDVELNAQPREPATATPGLATPNSGRPRRPRRPRAPEFDREPQEPDVETLVTEGDTVTNPTRSLSAVDEDLQEVFDGPP